MNYSLFQFELVFPKLINLNNMYNNLQAIRDICKNYFCPFNNARVNNIFKKSFVHVKS